MSVAEIERALGQLPREERWEIVRWLLEGLHESAPEESQSNNAGTGAKVEPALPDYAARRRRIFGNKVVPNLVVAGRAEERW